MGLPGDVTNVNTVYGAILLGTCIASSLTGIVFVQCILYYKLYPRDFMWTKILVFAVWAFDMMHTILIITAVWQCVIVNFDKPENMDNIPSTLGLSVATTALVTFMVHCFFANRIRMLTKSWYIAAPVVFLASLRLLSACVSTSEIIRLKQYSLFIRPYPAWVFTVGVTLSASVEFIITTTMIIFLGSKKTGFANMNHIINSLILYTLETGGITCLVTIASLICWLLMRHNLIFVGMHFAIAKLYANSLLASLNTRKRLRADWVHSSDRGAEHQLTPILSPTKQSHFSNRVLSPNTTQKSVQLNVNVETTVVSKIDHDDQKDHCVIEAISNNSQGVATFEPYYSLDHDISDREDRKYAVFV